MGTKDFLIQYEMVCCVTPRAWASLACEPAAFDARLINSSISFSRTITKYFVAFYKPVCTLLLQNGLYEELCGTACVGHEMCGFRPHGGSIAPGSHGWPAVQTTKHPAPAGPQQ